MVDAAAAMDDEDHDPDHVTADCVDRDEMSALSNLMTEDENSSALSLAKGGGKLHEYRIDFSDFVESTLPAVPEEAAWNDTKKMDDHDHILTLEENNNNVNNLVLEPSTTTPILSEPLSARQQVSLWLSRQSASNLSQMDLASQMSSFKSLIFPANRANNSSNNLSNQAHNIRGLQRNSRGRTEISRNYSTKSLLNGHYNVKSGRQSDMFGSEQTLNTMRKCETLLAIDSGRRDSTSDFKENRRRATSSLSIFQRAMQWRSRHRSRHSRRSELRRDESSPLKALKPFNRFRESTSTICGHCATTATQGDFGSCSRLTSRATSQQSIMISALNLRQSEVEDCHNEETFGCRICLNENVPLREVHRINVCGCVFCKDCVYQYLCMEIMESAYAIACPNPECERQGVFQLDEIEECVGKELMDKHRLFRLNTEVALDKTRTWCPEPDCDTVCHICTSTPKESEDSGVAVVCPSCSKTFCSRCSAPWHASKSCLQNGQELMRAKQRGEVSLMMKELENCNGDIKQCPMCFVPIERDAGCAQMMCKRCKHVFCWYCLTSLDDDFLLRHYDSGECKGRLGHSRLSILWHRAQVVAIFAGFGILILLAAPLLLMAAPCILCCKCKIIERIEAAAANEDDENLSNNGIDKEVEATEEQELSRGES